MTPRRTPSDAQRKTAAMTICKILGSELSVVAKPLSQVDVRNIPNRVEPAVRNWIRRHGKHEVYGSGAMATHQITGRQPADLDFVTGDPSTAAYNLAVVMRRGGVKCRVRLSQSPGAYVVQTYLHNEWVDALDIHPLEGHAGQFEFHGQSMPPLTKKGINIQRASDQLLRKANSITATRSDGSMGAAPARELKDTRDFVAVARLLLASVETRAGAQQARTQSVKSAIAVWERHLKTIPGAPAKPKRKAISKTRKIRFAKTAKANPAAELDDLIFAGGAAVVMRDVPIRAPAGATAGSPYTDPYAGAKYAKNPYEKEFADEIKRLEGRQKTTTRRKPRGTKKGKTTKKR